MLRTSLPKARHHNGCRRQQSDYLTHKVDFMGEPRRAERGERAGKSPLLQDNGAHNMPAQAVLKPLRCPFCGTFGAARLPSYFYRTAPSSAIVISPPDSKFSRNKNKDDLIKDFYLAFGNIYSFENVDRCHIIITGTRNLKWICLDFSQQTQLGMRPALTVGAARRP